MSRIAFIGLGNMGGPMALNLLKAGHELVVFDLSASALKAAADAGATTARSEEHTSELQSLMRISYAVFCLKKKTDTTHRHVTRTNINTNNTSQNRYNGL